MTVTEAGAELVRLARSVGLVKGDTVVVDGSKFRAVSSAKSVREREAMKRYLEQLDAADEQDEVVIDPSAVQAALEKLQNDRKHGLCAWAVDMLPPTTCKRRWMPSTH